MIIKHTFTRAIMKTIDSICLSSFLSVVFIGDVEFVVFIGSVVFVGIFSFYSSSSSSSG